MADRIYVTYTPTGGPESFHTAIHYERTDSAGKVIKHHVIEAGPENSRLSFSAKASEVLGEASRAGNESSGFGRVKAVVRNGLAPNPNEHPSSDPNAPYEVIAEGDDLSGHLARMQLFAHGVNRAGFAYRGHRQNSNTFAGCALRAGELPGPRGVARDPTGPAGELLEFFTPGLNETWEPPIGPSTSDDGDENGGPSAAAGSGVRLALPMPAPQQSQEPPPVRRLVRRGVTESLNDRFGNWTDTDGGVTPRNPNQPVPPPEPGRPLGIFTGKPMPLWTTPLPLGGLLNNSTASGNADWLTVPGGRSWGRNNAPESEIETAAPGSSFASSGNLNSSGGLAGWIAEMAGVDPDDPERFAPSAGGLLGAYLSGRR